MDTDSKLSQTLLELLENKLRHEYGEDKNRKLQKTKEILLYLAAIGACFYSPNAAQVFRPLLNKKSDYLPYPAFNKRYLSRTIARLKKQKDIQVTEKNNQIIIQLSKNGKEKVINNAIDELDIQQPKNWDGKWRLVIYDISSKRKSTVNSLRKRLLSFGFLPFQESVFIYPYSCFKEIELLRGFYGLSAEIHYLVVCNLENEDVFKGYFNLK